MIVLTAEHMLGYLGWPRAWWSPPATEGDPPVLASAAISVFNMTFSRARSYTRGRGFAVDLDGVTITVAHDLATVIVTASSRMLLNRREYDSATEDVSLRFNPEPTNVERKIPGHDWTLAELHVLNRYRRRAL